MELIQGERYQRSFRWLLDGVPQSLATWDIRAQIRTDDRPRGRLILDISAMFIKEPGGNVGLMALTIGADLTNDLDPRDFRRSPRWDLFLAKVGDPAVAHMLLEGPVTLNASATDVDGSETT